jgi:hypothetical protein
MRHILAAVRLHLLLILAVTVEIQAQGPASSGRGADWLAVDQVFGRKGVSQPDDVIRYNFPRNDLQVMAKGVQLKTAFALGGWIAMKRIDDGVMVMGDLVLLENEVAPVMRALQQAGVEQSALHNHVLGESPRVMYMHVSAHGDPVRIAQSIRDALAQTRTPLGALPTPSPAPINLDTAAVTAAIGTSGRVNGGVYQVSVPRRETIFEGGYEVPPSMGVATAINFQPTGGGKAAVTGDFVLLAAEVNPVTRALTQNGIEVTAVHSHLLEESPPLLFMHFWAIDDAIKLARGLRIALDLVEGAR